MITTNNTLLENQNAISSLKGIIFSYSNKFNWKEVSKELESQLKEIFDKVDKCDDLESLRNILQILDYHVYELKKVNSRSLIFRSIDQFGKYSDFYNLVRSNYEKKYPDPLKENLLTNWQFIDFAILELLFSLYKFQNDIFDDPV